MLLTGLGVLTETRGKKKILGRNYLAMKNTVCRISVINHTLNKNPLVDFLFV